MRTIFMLIGMVLIAFSGFMALCGLLDIYTGSEEWKAFMVSAMITLFVGGALYLTCKADTQGLTIQQGFIFTSAIWAIVPLFGALPFYLHGDFYMSFTDSYFEAMSGLVTCGATTMTYLDEAPKGILLWRALLNWLGGTGIIVLALAILPALKVGGMQLMKMESSDKSDKILPKARDIATGFVSIYVGFTVACALSLHLAGMPLFDAICHSMAALATGGFSTKDASIGFYDSRTIEGIIILFMVLGSLPFVLYMQAVRGHFRPLFKDKQVRTFLILLGLSVLSVAIWLHLMQDRPLGHALWHSLFNITSVMSTTGFTSENYGLWGSYGIMIIFLASLMGGCTGSTVGAIKIMRLQLLGSMLRQQIYKLIHPHRVYLLRYNERPVKDNVAESVLLFFFVYIASLMFFTLWVAATGADFLTSFSAASSALGNVGYGLGAVEGGIFKPLSDSAKWALSFAMYVGRLEFFTVFVLFVPTFWSSTK